MRPRRTEVLLAAVLALWAQLEVWWPAAAPGVGEVSGDRAVLALTALGATAPLALRRVAPLPVALAVAGAWLAQAVLAEPVEGLSTLVAALVAVASLTAHAEPRWAALGLAGFAVALAGDTGDAEDALFGAIVLGAAALGGALVRDRELRAQRLVRERELRAQAALVEERARIARELHDVIAHAVSVMVVQAEAGDALLDRDPERARAALEAIRSAGRDALAELRRLLGVLREPDDQQGVAPAPGLGGLDALLEQVRSAGVAVDLQVTGEPRALPAGVDLAAHRVVQEALTNVLKHAGGAHAVVGVHFDGEAVEVRVDDDGPDGATGPPGGGTVGMRERVALYGGTLRCGRREGGGYGVRARLPFEERR